MRGYPRGTPKQITLIARMLLLLLAVILPITLADGGCYDPTVHKCDCIINHSNCTAPNVWTNQCCQATPPPSPAPPATMCDRGCYDIHGGTHTCDCSITESQCSSGGSGIWTEGCGCDHSGDPGFHPCNTSSPVYGCYNAFGKHECSCDISQAACLRNSGTWTVGCSCGEQHSPPPAPAPPPLPLDGGRVTVTLKADCPASSYVDTFVRENLLSAMARLTAMHKDFVKLAVGNSCNTPWGSSTEAYAELTFDVSCATADHTVFVDQQLRHAFKDKETSSHALSIGVIEKPIVTATVTGDVSPSPWTNAKVSGMVAGVAIASSIAVGLLVFLMTRKVYRKPSAEDRATPILSSSYTPSDAPRRVQ